ncbi:MAG: non-homologous end-joining DNA ligase [Pseudomonadales bacterium]
MKLRLGSHTVTTSNDAKVLFPDDGLTKADVIGYYRDLADHMLPHLRDRCLTLQRFPDGIGAKGFYQQNRSAYFPDYVGRRRLDTAAGDDTVDHIVVDHAAALVYLADQATITLHGWLAVASQPRNPDRLVFDLDPADDDFATVVRCAREVRGVLELVGLEPFVMTSGSRGLHVSAPLDGSLEFDAARALARTLAEAVAARHPNSFTVEQRKRARKGRLYLDLGRNAYGQTAVLPYSLRAKPGAPAATPLDWDELGRRDLTPQRYGLKNLRRRLAQKDDPFSDYASHARAPQPDPDALAAWQRGG